MTAAEMTTTIVGMITTTADVIGADAIGMMVVGMTEVVVIEVGGIGTAMTEIVMTTDEIAITARTDAETVLGAARNIALPERPLVVSR